MGNHGMALLDRKIKINYFFTLTFFLVRFFSFSQNTDSLMKEALTPYNYTCGSNLLLKNNLSLDSNLEKSLFKINLLLADRVKKNEQVGRSSTSGPYTIPVVFHVIQDANNSTISPTYSQIQMQLASLNAAFSNSLSSLNNVTTGSRAVNTAIQFCFAKKQWINGSQVAWPNSNLGVIYYNVTNSITTNIDISSNASLASLSALTSSAFPSNMYLNIWCVPNISTSSNTNINAQPSVIGIGTFPWMSLPIDGIVMRNDCIGNNTYNNFTGNMFSYLDKGNILAHEVGHFLGLFHTFETIVNSNISTVGGSPGCYGVSNPSTEGDLVYDTPPTMLNSQVPSGIYNTCNELYFPYGIGFNAVRSARIHVRDKVFSI